MDLIKGHYSSLFSADLYSIIMYLHDLRDITVKKAKIKCSSTKWCQLIDRETKVDKKLIYVCHNI